MEDYSKSERHCLHDYLYTTNINTCHLYLLLTVPCKHWCYYTYISTCHVLLLLLTVPCVPWCYYAYNHTCHVLLLLLTVPCVLWCYYAYISTCHVLLLLLTVPCIPWCYYSYNHTCHVLLLLLTVPCVLWCYYAYISTCHVLLLLLTVPWIQWCYYAYISTCHVLLLLLTAPWIQWCCYAYISTCHVLLLLLTICGFSGILDRFRLKSTITSVLCKKVAFSEIRSDLSEMSFLCQTFAMGQILPKYLEPQSVPHSANLSFSVVLKHFCLKVTKKNSFQSNNYFEWTFFLILVWNRSKPVENCFETQNEPHWEVQSFSGLLDRFRLKLIKTHTLCQKVVSQKYA